MFLGVSIRRILDGLSLSLKLAEVFVECELKVLVPHQVQLQVVFPLVLPIE